MSRGVRRNKRLEKLIIEYNASSAAYNVILNAYGRNLVSTIEVYRNMDDLEIKMRNAINDMNCITNDERVTRNLLNKLKKL